MQIVTCVIQKPFKTLYKADRCTYIYQIWLVVVGAVGTLGTGGRRCAKDSLGSEGCDILCCGRGYDTRRELFIEKCGCKFNWCCKVKCKVCREWRDIHTCKMPHIT
ncbi:Protein Wnt-5 [Araneus ventricosus]|uniref:Protein Wnt n=1 Tax=Araneus ventricosus TaxID=182803 RepID=A0A4Y2B592_ARAVE|nr:Protein Wnt-5 [Araneus ventricosus]